MEQDEGVRTERAVVLPFAPPRSPAMIPSPRTSDEDLTSLGVAVEDPVRFFAGLVHAVWMLALASAVVLGIVLTGDTVI